MQSNFRVVVYLCVLLLLNEFGPAHFRRVLSRDEHNLGAISKKHGGKTAPDELARERRGAVLTLGKYLFKALEFSSKYFKDVTSLVSLATTIYVVVNDNCCSGMDNTVCELQEEAKEISEYIDSESESINEIQLETENLQDLVENLNSLFNTTVENMRNVGYISSKVLEGINPDIRETLNVTTLELQKMLLEKQNAGESVNYVVLGKKYYTRIDQVINIAVPLFATVLPKLVKITKFGTERLGRLKSWEMTEKFKNIKLPGTNTAAYKGMKSWFAKTTSYVSSKAGKLRTIITTNYAKAVTVVKNIKKGFSVLTGFVMGAYNIYVSVQNIKKCQKLKTAAKDAVNELKKAKEQFLEIHRNVTSAKETMIKAAEDMYESVSNDVFLSDIKEMRDNMVSIQGDGKGMQEMIDGATRYLDSIKSSKNLNDVVPLFTDLYHSLGPLPFVYTCLTDKTWFVGSIARGCKDGDDPLPELIKLARQRYSDNIEDCEKRTGMPYITDEAINNMIDQVANDEGFEKDCVLNSKSLKDSVCAMKCQALKVDEIARQVESRGISENSVKIIFNSCPPCKNTDKVAQMICIIKQLKPDVTDEEIQEKMPELSLAEIRQIDCSKYEDRKKKTPKTRTR